ncbi:MAG TPA: thioredoxin domain-containing protein [Aquaticitalea sp.]|nr:thioredoxin domain-containing protein [Aquaticitalea sp.]
MGAFFCKNINDILMIHPYTNALITETSPYLLQHAHNPVNWYAWNEDTLTLAKTNNKLLIISIGYAACHWCHVMEHESFEDDEVAEVMNTHFLSIKVDREERPDIDNVYMNAIQLMTGAGGWPLNIIALPDGRPIWGGTYFRKEQWMSALEQIFNLYTSNPVKLQEYADKLETGLKQMDMVHLNMEVSIFTMEFIGQSMKNWSTKFDDSNGGMKGAPKFMMPNNYHFILRYAHQFDHKYLKEFVHLTLRKMAYGGIYDQIGGGFSRYSVDDKWHVPHFEKMLYDNAQLVSLYADAYLITKDELYKEVITKTLEFVQRELTGSEGNFYSSLDADSLNSEGKLEEGAFYVWKKEHLKKTMKEDYALFSEYYNVNEYGFWEHGNYVLIRKDDEAAILEKYQLSKEDSTLKKQVWKTILLEERNKRERPRLDDKTLTSWNALMLKAYVDAYRVLGETSYLEIAIENGEFILNHQLRKDGGLNHNYKNGKSTINGFLEDYAATIEAFLLLYEQTLRSKWLLTARDLANYTLDHFFDDRSKMFYFTSNEDADLVSRSFEYRDNVIPASNSIMAKNLFKLSHHFINEHFLKIANTMLNNVKPEMQTYPSGYSNWLDLMLHHTNPFYEVVVVGEKSIEKIAELNTTYIPNKIIAGSTNDEKLPLLENRYVQNQTLIYICKDKSCSLPVSEVDDALKQLR